MKKIIALMIVVLMTVSFTTKSNYGDFIVFTNEQYTAVRVEIYYDYQDGYGYTHIGSIHLPGNHTKTIHAKKNSIHRYAYRTNRDDILRRVTMQHVRVY